jgi:hypothetical protein
MNKISLIVDDQKLKSLKDNYHNRFNYDDGDFNWDFTYFTFAKLELDGKIVNKPLDIEALPFTLNKTDTEWSEFEILTCTCGISGCAGIFTGTKAKVTIDVCVEWNDIDCGFPQKYYKFDYNEYCGIVEKVNKLIEYIHC